jgi:hypothetical protein
MNIKNIIIGVIIAVVFVMFCAYGTKLIYEAPNYEDFCNYTSFMPPEKLPVTNCTIPGTINIKTQECYNNKGTPVPIFDEKGCQIDVNCDHCQQEYDKAEEKYSKNLFIISIVFSIIIISVAAFLIKVESVSGGWMFGSLMYIIYGTGRYWRFMNDWLRFIILGIALIILIYIGYRLARRK